ncbi:MAG TPA: Hpt domain-containing protein [Candidatus Desulfofervidus auxilii]|uniref:Hpt domain-containing protein n=1 Tax=Desulfofervidus auxilii TaxID=1621989 RepID=A0A7C0U2R5_DESA2|nr:Hpt domain-containing protein [Candidatus Desulfofervidus auxilii]
MFDLNKVMEMVEGDKELLKELLNLFFSDYPEKLAKIHHALEKNDAKTVYETAHSLKGACGNLGLSRAYNLSLEIEKMCKEGKLERVEEAYKKLVKELDEFKQFVSDINL